MVGGGLMTMPAAPPGGGQQSLLYRRDVSLSPSPEPPSAAYPRDVVTSSPVSLLSRSSAASSERNGNVTEPPETLEQLSSVVYQSGAHPITTIIPVFHESDKSTLYGSDITSNNPVVNILNSNKHHGDMPSYDNKVTNKATDYDGNFLHHSDMNHPHDPNEEPPHYIDSSDSSIAEDSDNSSIPKTPSPPPPLAPLVVLETPPSPVKTIIAFDWSNLNFGDLQFSPSVREDNEICDKVPIRRNKNNRYSVEILPDETYDDTMRNIINTKECDEKPKDPKTIFKNCKRKIIRSSKTFKDRSRSVENRHDSSLAKTLFRNRSSDQRCSTPPCLNKRKTNVLRQHSSGNCHLIQQPNHSCSCAMSNSNNASTNKSCNNVPISGNNPTPNACKKCNDSNMNRSHGETGSLASLPSGVKLRARLKESIWVTGVRRRESIGLLTQPMLSAIRGAGRRVKYRARSISKSRGSLSGGSDDSHSGGPHSSDYEEDLERTDSASLLDRFRGLRKDMQKKISKVKSPRGSVVPQYGETSPAQLPSAGGDTTMPLGRAPLRHNRTAGCSPAVAPYTGPFIGRAVALADFQPSPYDVDLLKLKKGDVIDIISKSPSGQWRGSLNGRVGEFKFILVEEESERDRTHRRLKGHRHSPQQPCPPYVSLEALLRSLRLGHLLQVFMLNGYESLDQFREVEEQDLDSLGIKDPDTRSHLLSAVAAILEYEQNCLSIVVQVSESSVTNNTSSSRDSGCFTDTKVASLAPDCEDSIAEGRQSSPSTDNSSGYQGKGNYAIPHCGEVSSTLQEVPDTTLDSSPSDDVPVMRKKYSVTGNSNKSSSAKPKQLRHHEPDSYRATLATVRPPTPELPEQESAETQDDAPLVRQKSDLATSSERSSADTGVSSLPSDRGSVSEEPPGDGQR